VLGGKRELDKPVSRYGSVAVALSRGWVSAVTKFPAQTAILENMNTRGLMSTVTVMNGPSAHGLRVHVSDASPRGFCGHVTAVQRNAVTATNRGELMTEAPNPVAPL
jgi:hypothetical protein